MAGMDRDGLTIKRQLEVINDLRNEAETIFKDLVPINDVVDTSDSTLLGRFIGLVSHPLADLWEATQEVYSAFDPNSAYGIALDNLVMYSHLTRLPATPSQAIGVLWGDMSTLIEEGSQMRALDNSLFRVANDVTLNMQGCIGGRFKVDDLSTGLICSISVNQKGSSITYSYTIKSDDTEEAVYSELRSKLSANSNLEVKYTSEYIVVELRDIQDRATLSVGNMVALKAKKAVSLVSVETGFKEFPANTINSIATPVMGLDSVTNPFPAIPGSSKESDEELRKRFRESKFSIAQNIADSLYAQLLALNGVLHVRIYENTTSVYNSEFDIQPHSFKVLILGGDNKEIANTIWLNSPIGIASSGDENVVVTDSMGTPHNVKFQRPVSRNIYIVIDIETDNNFPDNGITLMRNNMVEYFRDNLTVGSKIIYSRLFNPLNSVIGHEVVDMKIGLSPIPSNSNTVNMAYNELPVLDSLNITINVLN